MSQAAPRAAGKRSRASRNTAPVLRIIPQPQVPLTAEQQACYDLLRQAMTDVLEGRKNTVILIDKEPGAAQWAIDVAGEWADDDNYIGTTLGVFGDFVRRHYVHIPSRHKSFDLAQWRPSHMTGARSLPDGVVDLSAFRARSVS